MRWARPGTGWPGVPPAKVSHFAGEAAVLDADELSGVSEDKRLTLLACLVHTARIRARDEVVTMFCKRMAIITKKAREKLEELREQHRTESERLLGCSVTCWPVSGRLWAPPRPSGAATR